MALSGRRLGKMVRCMKQMERTGHGVHVGLVPLGVGEDGGVASVDEVGEGLGKFFQEEAGFLWVCASVGFVNGDVRGGGEDDEDFLR